MKKIEIIISLLQAMVGDEWELSVRGTFINFHYKYNNRNGYYDFRIFIFDWELKPCFDLRVGSFSEDHTPFSNTNESAYYRAVGAICNNPCVEVVKKLLGEFTYDEAMAMR